MSEFVAANTSKTDANFSQKLSMSCLGSPLLFRFSARKQYRSSYPSALHKNIQHSITIITTFCNPFRGNIYEINGQFHVFSRQLATMNNFNVADNITTVIVLHFLLLSLTNVFTHPVFCSVSSSPRCN